MLSYTLGILPWNLLGVGYIDSSSSRIQGYYALLLMVKSLLSVDITPWCIEISYKSKENSKYE